MDGILVFLFKHQFMTESKLQTMLEERERKYKRVGDLGRKIADLALEQAKVISEIEGLQKDIIGERQRVKTASLRRLCLSWSTDGTCSTVNCPLDHPGPGALW